MSETPDEPGEARSAETGPDIIPTQTPSAAPTALSPAPDVDLSALTGLEAPDMVAQAGDALLQGAEEGYLRTSEPLSLAQILPPGQSPSVGQIAPSFDLVRISPDGSAVIAGRAEPGAEVQIFSGGLPVAQARASARGEFVVFLETPDQDRLDLQIPEPPQAAQLVISQDDILILPPQPDSQDGAAIIVRRTPDAVQILQPAGPSIPDQISLDLVTYSQSGSVVLAGRGQPFALARVYADAGFAGEVEISSGGDWRLEIDDIAEGRYVLRVDEIGVEGAVLSRIESPFQREFPAADMPESFSQGAKIIVQPGNTLWLMATEAYGNGDAYTQIFSANADSIRDPDLIYPGQIISIPKAED